ncbi:hypothetical protein STVA_03820 [Allostella vacuolata]|nr:hypothetical protein STVA_03820 [Stella vacuolata]
MTTTNDGILTLEPMASNQISDPELLGYGGKPWRCALIPQDAIAENRTLAGLPQQFGATR